MLVLVAVLGVAGSACSKSSPAKDGAKRSASRPVDSTTTTGKAPVEDAVLAGYRAFWDTYLAAADPMNPEDPRLVEHATNGELETLQKAFLARKSAGEVIRGTIDSAPRIVAVNADGTSATLRDCYADHAGIYDAVSGTRKDKESGVRHLVKVDMILAGGWKVASLTLEEDGCTPGS